MMDRQVIATVLPHSDFGDPECCGCLNGIITGDIAQITCNECGYIVRTVSPADLQCTLDQMESTLDVAIAKCPHCGAVHLAPGFSTLLAFVCPECEKAVNLE